MSEASYRIDTPSQLKAKFRDAYDCATMLIQAGLVEVVVRKPTRSSEQNRRLWAVLNDIAKQVHWPVNGKQELITPDDWKAITSAAYHSEQRMALGINGGLVMLGISTRVMRKAEFAEYLTMLQAFGDERGVKWSDPALKAMEEAAEIHAATRGKL